MPLFSIISITLNDLPGLKRTELSVLEQTEQDFEWVVVDGASTDGTVEFLRGNSLPYLRWTSERDRGIYDAMNRGTALAKGRYVVYLNGGDAFADANCLAAVRQALTDADWPELCYGGVNWRFADGALRYRAPRPLERAIWHGLPGMHQATFYRLNFIEQPPYDLSYMVSSDYYISARCFQRGGRACYVDRALANFGVGGSSMKKCDVSLRECWRLQRDVLGVGWCGRIRSAARRWFTMRVLMVLHYLVHRPRARAPVLKAD